MANDLIYRTRSKTVSPVAPHPPSSLNMTRPNDHIPRSTAFNHLIQDLPLSMDKTNHVKVLTVNRDVAQAGKKRRNENIVMDEDSGITESGDICGQAPTKLRASCQFCRRRKIRCDGNLLGCGACVQRKQSCFFAEQAKMGRPKRDTLSASTSSHANKACTEMPPDLPEAFGIDQIPPLKRIRLGLSSSAQRAQERRSSLDSDRSSSPVPSTASNAQPVGVNYSLHPPAGIEYTPTYALSGMIPYAEPRPNWSQLPSTALGRHVAQPVVSSARSRISSIDGASYFGDDDGGEADENHSSLDDDLLGPNTPPSDSVSAASALIMLAKATKS